MNLPEISGLMYEVGRCVQETLLLISQGKHSEAGAVASRSDSLKSQCAEKNIDVNFFVEYLCPLHDGPTMALIPPPMGNWPLPQGTNEKTINVHITLIFKFLYMGHPDMIADGFRVRIANAPDDEEPDDGAPPAGSEGGLTSIEDTRRLLKDAGLDGFFEN